MSTKRVTMQKLKEMLRLKHETQLSQRQIARCLGLSVGAISKYLQRAEKAGIDWPLPEQWSDRDLKARLQPARRVSTSVTIAEPDFVEVCKELARKGMTRYLLWQEYAQAFPDNHYSYSHFTVLFRRWRQKQQLSMRQQHQVGEKLFVDYCGPTLPVVNPDTGEIRQAQVFVAVLGVSSYTYAEATWSQSLPIGLGRMLELSSSMGDVLRLWCQITSKVRSLRPVVTTPISIPLTNTWHNITVSPSSPHGPINPKIKPKQKSASKS